MLLHLGEARRIVRFWWPIFSILRVYAVLIRVWVFLSGLGTCGHHCGPACGELRFPCKASRLDNVQDFCRQGLGVWGLGVLEVRGLGVYGLRG